MIEKLVLLKAEVANFRLTTPKAFTLTLGILGTLAHFRHFPFLMTKDAAQHRSWTFYEAVKLDDLVKSHEYRFRWLSKTVHIQGVVIFQVRSHTYGRLSDLKIAKTQ